MKLERFDKRYLPMLWAGLGLWAGSMLVSLVLEWAGCRVESQGGLVEMAKRMYQSAPVLCLLVLCLIGPVLEEFSFRLWAVGKMWTTIVCLCLMGAVAVSELGLWGLLVVGVFVAVWLLVKDDILRNWLNAAATSAGFALCHISGFEGLSAGMALGLVDIFGMALVMCWLVLNLNFWFSPLLHVLNNTLSIVLPLVFLPEPADNDRYVVFGEGEPLVISTHLEPVRAFSDGWGQCDGRTGCIWVGEGDTLEECRLCMVGEPAEVAVRLAEKQGAAQFTYFDWRPEGENLEERIVYSAEYSLPRPVEYALLLQDYCKAAADYRGRPLEFDTAAVALLEPWLVFDDGREERLTLESEVYESAVHELAAYSGAEFFTENVLQPDSTAESQIYTLPLKDTPESQSLKWVKRLLERLYGYRLTFKEGRRAVLITVK